MEQEAFLRKLRDIKANLRRLTEQYTVLRKHLSLKEAENESLKKEIVLKEAMLNDFKNSQKISNIVSELSSKAPDSAELKLRINGFIREIDRCIAHLEQSL